MYVDAKWSTSLKVGALVTLVAAVHYMYMREFWVQLEQSPMLYRYIDWSITVPLQMVEFYLILSAVKPDLGGGMFWRLLIGTVVMLAAGYGGEGDYYPMFIGLVVGLLGWVFILLEIFGLDEPIAKLGVKGKILEFLRSVEQKIGLGEAGTVAEVIDNVNPHVKSSFQTMRIIVTAGWSIYPIGYVLGMILGSDSDKALNLVYNLADLVNKIAFCLAIWHSAKQSTLEKSNKSGVLVG